MPKFVDHEARREEIVEAVWRLVAREGFSAVTMRDLAAELGFSNGSLARYFPTKAAILRASLERANAATNRRAAAAIGDRGGLEAFRLLCIEIMPLDREKLDEARVVVAFWNYAVGDDDLITVFDAAMREWRLRLGDYLSQAARDHEIEVGHDLDLVVDTAMAMLMGLQINALFSAASTTPERQLRMLDGLIAELRRPLRAASPTSP
ncbi:MAG: TetR family transcriptional regulator [Streptosporangiales bacterium]|nr:TetR family transcriptional regulator [Streptosporangiales bacterium]